MRLQSKWNRRSFLASVGVIAGSILAPRKLFSWNRRTSPGSAPVRGFGQTGNPYEELGVTTVINCEGTMTMLGGSLPHPELEVAAGKRIAEMLKLPDGYTALVTSGAAAAIQSGLAGILTGGGEHVVKVSVDVADVAA